MQNNHATIINRFTIINNYFFFAFQCYQMALFAIAQARCRWLSVCAITKSFPFAQVRNSN